jgi:hypothetical protein
LKQPVVLPVSALSVHFFFCQIPDERKLDLLKTISASSPFAVAQDSRQLLPSVVQLLKVYALLVSDVFLIPICMFFCLMEDVNKLSLSYNVLPLSIKGCLNFVKICMY